MKPMIPLRITGFAAALAIAASGVTAAPTAAKTTILAGKWAGDNFALRTVRDGAMVQGKCAVGKISAPVQLGTDGKFTATGYFNKMTPGYRLSDIAPRDQPAQFEGRVTNNALELTVKTGAGKTSYRMLRGKTLKFDDCGQQRPTRIN